MQLSKFVLCLSVLFSGATYSKIHFDLALLRGNNMSFQSAVTLAVGERPIKAYQDENTYIEAQLIEEKDHMPRVKLTVSTKNEHGMFLVRGMPEVVANVTPGLCMSSIQCNSAQDNFVLLVAMSEPSH